MLLYRRPTPEYEPDVLRLITRTYAAPVVRTSTVSAQAQQLMPSSCTLLSRSVALSHLVCQRACGLHPCVQQVCQVPHLKCIGTVQALYVFQLVHAHVGMHAVHVQQLHWVVVNQPVLL